MGAASQAIKVLTWEPAAAAAASTLSTMLYHRCVTAPRARSRGPRSLTGCGRRTAVVSCGSGWAQCLAWHSTPPNFFLRLVPPTTSSHSMGRTTKVPDCAVLIGVVAMLCAEVLEYSVCIASRVLNTKYRHGAYYLEVLVVCAISQLENCFCRHGCHLY